MLELYSRQKLLSVILTGKDEMTAISSFDDGIHQVKVTLVCRTSTSEILSARAEMIKYPWNLCREAAKIISLIEGKRIGPGVRREIEQTIGKKEGCFHIADLVIEAIRGIIQSQYRLRYSPAVSREERIKMVQDDMRGTCFAYNHPELKSEATGDWSEGNSLLPDQYEELKKIWGQEI